MVLALISSALGVAALWAVLLALNRRHRARCLTALRAEWGRAHDRQRDLRAVAAYHRARSASDPARALDDRTWEDLNMNDVFSMLDRTESLVGQPRTTRNSSISSTGSTPRITSRTRSTGRVW